MYPGVYGVETPDRVAVINSGSGEVMTYGRLNDRSNQLAQLLYAQGLRRGDHIAIFMDNNLKYYEVGWAAMRSGLYITTINRYLTAEEAGYIVTDSGSTALITTEVLRDVARELMDHIPNCPIRLMAEGTIDGYESYEATLDAMPAENLAEEPQGAMMLYSSGTTGRPKGIKHPLPDVSVRDVGRAGAGQSPYGFDQDSVYLSPAPLYHSAPFGFSMGILRGGGTVIMMPRFDARDALRCIEEYKVTHSQWVPTMFVRMRKLDPEEREGWDLSSHKVAIHAAAPCPVEVKRQMIEWWGPILFEYYAGTESNGSTTIDSEDWLAHPGSVGQARGSVIHICDDDGNELPTGEPGVIYFEQERMSFEYHNDPEKTRSAQHPQHPNWSALGDVGYLDEDGYLYLTDRKSFMIISGGVNIYPQEIEDALIMNPKVADVAVFGVPNEDFGEEVKAVVELADGVEASDALEQQLMAFSREHLAHYMCPRSIDFIDELPRLPTGKLYKRILRDKYWGKHDTKIV